MLRWLWVALLVLLVDQATKLLANANLELHRPMDFLPGLNITLAYNRGAAFSFLSQSGGWQRWFFVVLAIAVSGFIVRWIHGLPRTEVWLAVALSLILGGAVGNVIDRVYLGYVVDFLDFYYVADSCLPFFSASSGQCHWPIFNIADSAICAGAVMLVVDGFRRKDNAEQAAS
ncbi:MAG TPA: lipoprotein signal peptidase [Candidatus Tenderia sp.]|nr:lipoprotein signal peptidase [Candidatus Tenderia sp.]